jgi:hypothetical protein
MREATLEGVKLFLIKHLLHFTVVLQKFLKKLILIVVIMRKLFLVLLLLIMIQH